MAGLLDALRDNEAEKKTVWRFWQIWPDPDGPVGEYEIGITRHFENPEYLGLDPAQYFWRRRVPVPVASLDGNYPDMDAEGRIYGRPKPITEAEAKEAARDATIAALAAMVLYQAAQDAGFGPERERENG